jgi:D-alanyl-lipoteichoic acid acyltransferase DltB (MBOAT superfamily)
MANSVRFLANVAVCIVMEMVSRFLFTGYTALRVPAPALFGGVAMSENISQPLSREKLRDFLSQLQVDLADGSPP